MQDLQKEVIDMLIDKKIYDITLDAQKFLVDEIYKKIKGCNTATALSIYSYACCEFIFNVHKSVITSMYPDKKNTDEFIASLITKSVEKFAEAYLASKK